MKLDKQQLIILGLSGDALRFRGISVHSRDPPESCPPGSNHEQYSISMIRRVFSERFAARAEAAGKRTSGSIDPFYEKGSSDPSVLPSCGSRLLM